jgi:hypothetical protein
LSIAVLVPEGRGLEDGEGYLPSMVQGVLAGDFTKFSAMDVLDRQNLENVIQEGESGYYADEENFVRLGEVTGMKYILNGALQKTGQGFSFQLKVTEAASGVSRAAYSGSVQMAELDNFTGIRKASADLLAQMGVDLTDAGRAALLEAASSSTVRAETALAKGVDAQRGGTVVEALSYYFQAASYDASLTEAASRVNILTANITSGNMGEDIRNDIERRDQWRARLAEAEQVYADYMKQQPHYSLVYNVNLKHGETNYSNNTVPISGVTIDLVPDAAWFNTAGSVVRVVNVVREGLLATKQAAKWGLDWPRNTVANSPFGNRDQRFEVVVELVNSEGKIIGSERRTMQRGYDVEWSEGTLRRLAPRIRGVQNLGFSRVNAYDITTNLSVRIASIDGMDAETAAKTKGINILREAEYVRLPEVIAGVDSRAVASLIQDIEINSSGEITGYKGGGGKLVIPPSIFGLPITAIGKNAFTKEEVIVTYDYKYADPKQTEYRYWGKGLSDVTIPNSVTSIGENAFRGNALLSVIVIPNNVTSIDAGAFVGISLTSIIISDNVTLLYDTGSVVGERLYGPFTDYVHTFAFNAFESYYEKNGKKAGTYTRPSPKSKKWTYRP